MRILFVSMVWPANGSSNMYTDLMDEFVLESHDVCVATLCEKRNKTKTNLSFENGISVLRIKCGNIQKVNKYTKVINSFLAGYKLKREVLRYFSAYHFDLIVFALPPLTVVKPLVRIKKKLHCKMYLLLKEFWPQDPVDLGAMKYKGIVWKVFKYLENYLYKNSDFIGTMSPKGIDYVIANKNTEHCIVEVNPNSERDRSRLVSPFEKGVIREKYGLSSNEKIFVFGGNLGVSQGIPEMISSIKHCSDLEGVCFLIIGDGTEKDVIIKELSSQANVRIMGMLKKEEYLELVSSCDFGLLFLFPKYTVPNFPSRAVSYLCNGLPIIAAVDSCTDVGDIIERNRCGYQLKNGDVACFRKIMIDAASLTKEQYQTMSRNCLTLFKNDYTTKQCYTKIIEKISK